MTTKKELHELERKMLNTKADELYLVARKGDLLAKKNGYKSLEGMKAVVRHLCDKHHWFPHEVRRLTADDLNLLLADEISI